MGNKQSKEQIDLVSSHPYFKRARVINENEHRLMKVLIPCDEQGYRQWKKLLSTHQKALLQSQFLLLPKKHALNKQGFCSNSGNAQIYYEYFPYILSEEVLNRQYQQQRFRQSDLWYLLLSLVGASHETDSLGHKVGDIKPQNVFINSDGLLKISSVFSFPIQTSNFKKSIDLQPTFLAPEDTVKLSLGSISNDQNKKSEIFSIGLTLVATGVLENLQSSYDTKLLVFNSDLVKNLISKWNALTCYSEIFRSIISNLVNFNPENRISAGDLWQWISKYEPNIKSKQKFLITQVPIEIERQINQLRNSSKTPFMTPITTFRTPNRQQISQHPKEGPQL